MPPTPEGYSVIGIARNSLLVLSLLVVAGQSHAIDRHASHDEAVPSPLLQFLESILDGHPSAAQWSKVRRGAELCWRTRECGLLDQALFPNIRPLSAPSGHLRQSSQLHQPEEKI